MSNLFSSFYNRGLDPEMLKNIREGVEEKAGYANVLHRLFLDEVKKFEDELDNDEEIGVYLASSADGRCLRVEKIGYRDPYFIILEGLINDSQRAKLIQHVTQISVLFIPLSVSSLENRQPKRFGFEIPDDDQ